MSKELIKQLEEAVMDVLDADPQGLADAAKRLSIMFTSERGEISDKYFSDPESLNAYVAAFMLPNAVKVLHCLAQIDAQGNSVLDLGTGPGTAVLASSLYFSNRHPGVRVRFAGIEQNKAALLKAHELFKRIAPPYHSFESATASVEKGGLERILKAERFDLVFAANVLNEFSDSAYGLCLDLISNRLSDDGALIIIEPALRDNARALMALRDRLVADKVTRVLAPCLHNHACPMLATNERDWCHFYIDWDPPEYLAELDQLSGMNHEHLKMSYLILRPAKPCDADSQNDDLWRAVSCPLDTKGKREFFLCGSNGELKRVRRTNKDASDLNEDFDKVSRGDIVSYSSADRIRKDDPFSINKKWSRY